MMVTFLFKFVVVVLVLVFVFLILIVDDVVVEGIFTFFVLVFKTRQTSFLFIFSNIVKLHAGIIQI